MISAERNVTRSQIAQPCRNGPADDLSVTGWVLGAGSFQNPPLPASPFLKDMFLVPIFSVFAVVGLT